MMPMKKDNHYVPRFYLKLFLEEEGQVETPRQRSVCVYDKETGKPGRKGIDNIGYVPHLYNLKLTDGSITKAIEDFFGEHIEYPAKRIHDKILNQISISPKERVEYSRFLYFSYARTAGFLNYMSWFYKNRASVSEDSLPDLEDIDQLIDDVGISSEVSTLELMIEMSKIFAPVIYNMHWQFLIAPEGEHFITSDNPLILNDPSKREISTPFSGWNNPNIQLTFPLSPKICLKATWKNNKKNYQKADMKFLRAVNFRTYFFATQYIFSAYPFEPSPLDIGGTFEYNLFDKFEPCR